MNRQAQVRRDLVAVEAALRRWDPIGVLPGPGEDEGPMDEYDSYAPLLLGLLQKGGDVAVVEQELIRIRIGMGLKAYPKTDRPTAEHLVSWWSSLERA